MYINKYIAFWNTEYTVYYVCFLVFVQKIQIWSTKHSD